MRKVLRLVVRMALIVPLLGVAGPRALSALTSGILIPAVGEALPPAQTQADFDLMRKALEEAHSGLYRYSSKAEIDGTFDAERAKLNRPLTKAEFMAVLKAAPVPRPGGMAPRRDIKTGGRNE